MKEKKDNINFLVSVISLVIGALGFYGFSAKDYHMGWLIVFSVCMGIFIINNRPYIISFRDRFFCRNEYDYIEIIKHTKLLYTYIMQVKRVQSGSVYAKVLTQEYHVEKDSVYIDIKIDEIDYHEKKYSFILLGKNENTEVFVFLDRQNIQLIRTLQNGNALYEIDLPDERNFNMEIKIKMPIEQHCSNLYFYPRNYVKKVGIVKIKTNKPKIYFYELKKNKRSRQNKYRYKYDKPKVKQTENNQAIFSSQTDKYIIDYVLFIEKYNQS